MLNKTPSPSRVHDYSIHLTEDELLSIYRVITFPEQEGDWLVWDSFLDLIEGKGKKVTNA